jgi:transposase-like protein
MAAIFTFLKSPNESLAKVGVHVWSPVLRQWFKLCPVQGVGEMSESKQRQFHTPELKAKVGLEAIRGIKTLNEIALEFGVHPVQVGQWKKEIQDHAKTLFEGKRGPKPVAAHREPDLLYSEIGKLKVELDWLKKKSGMNLP